MKILYAASNRKGARIQLNRFLKSIENDNFEIKIAAYVQNSEYADWNLSSLLNFLYKDAYSFEGQNIEIYYKQVKQYNPDLIISDLELFTSFIGIDLGIPIWQVSPLLIFYALNKKTDFKIYNALLKEQNLFPRIKNILYNSDRKFIYSHFGDLSNIDLNKEYEWIRPYHVIGKKSKLCEHDMVGIEIERNAKSIQFLLKEKDSILFSPFDESFNEIKIKNIENMGEYACNLKNSKIFLNSGFTDHCADGFYNNKFSYIIPNFNDEESIINMQLSKAFGTGALVANQKIEIKEIEESKYNPNIKYLREEINEYAKIRGL